MSLFFNNIFKKNKLVQYLIIVNLIMVISMISLTIFTEKNIYNNIKLKVMNIGGDFSKIDEILKNYKHKKVKLNCQFDKKKYVNICKGTENNILLLIDSEKLENCSYIYPNTPSFEKEKCKYSNNGYYVFGNNVVFNVTKEYKSNKNLIVLENIQDYEAIEKKLIENGVEYESDLKNDDNIKTFDYISMIFKGVFIIFNIIQVFIIHREFKNYCLSNEIAIKFIYYNGLERKCISNLLFISFLSKINIIIYMIIILGVMGIVKLNNIINLDVFIIFATLLINVFITKFIITKIVVKELLKDV